MEKAVAIETEMGVFENYRDGIILKNIEWNSPRIIFDCNISSNAIINSSKNKTEYYNFKIIFDGLISLFMAEYDTYEAIDKGFPKSSDNVGIFEIILNSNYLKKLPVRSDWGKVNHYRLTTYDDVFDIIAKSYTIVMENNLNHG